MASTDFFSDIFCIGMEFDLIPFEIKAISLSTTYRFSSKKKKRISIETHIHHLSTRLTIGTEAMPFPIYHNHSPWEKDAYAGMYIVYSNVMFVDSFLFIVFRFCFWCWHCFCLLRWIVHLSLSLVKWIA